MHDQYDDDDDPEAPDESDMDSDEADELLRCPRCRAEVYDQADVCPYCGCDMMGERGGGKSIWFIAVVIVALIATLLMVW